MKRSTPVRVMHVTYDMRIGGTEQVIRSLIEATPPTEVQMSIFCIEEPLGTWGEELRLSGTPIFSCARRPNLDFRVLRTLRGLLRENAIDVVHCHQYTPWTYGALAAVGLQAQVVFTEHGRFYPDRASPKRRLINPVLASLTRHITAISAATRRALEEFEHLNAERIDVIYNGIEGIDQQPEDVLQLKARLGIPTQAPVIGTVARLDPIKNHVMMLRAFRGVLDKHPECRLLLVGDGEERPRIEALIAELGISERVLLPGYIPEPATWLAAMDVFLLSSYSEGTSMTLLEAMSLGKPSVVTAVGGNPEIVTAGQTGHVSPSDDHEFFSNKIISLLDSAAERQQLGESARKSFLKHFSATAMAAGYQRVYQQVIGSPKS
jgi:glycosyltransferase involved in cell wall biosynthesis